MLSTLALAALVSLPAASSQTLAPADALARLRTATVFQDDAVGYAGALSDNVAAFRVLFDSPDAARSFGALAREGSLVGRLYAAIGLKHHDPTAFAMTLAALRRHADERVLTQFGCLGGSERVGELLRSGDAAVVRLAPGETVPAWLKAHGSGHLDVEGGGYTGEFGRVAAR
ncbi:MAG: hypothetical protein IT383_20905 [Deltaproteobacteria bacterium]|nr:hypothetical protein [Deltaproteobacteria bacterium]